MTMNLKTFFATPERKQKDELTFEIDQVKNNEFISGLMHTISGVLAIVNDKRQVIAVNDSFLRFLGIDDPEKQLGLRPGEILQCLHAEEQPGGCGTAKHCRSCGAAVAMVTSLSDNLPTERICALQSKRGEKIVDMVLNVRAQPIEINSSKYLILFIQDITRQQHQASLERAFFHDVSNLMSLLVGASELLHEDRDSDMVETVHRATLRLKSEIEIQRYLNEDKAHDYTPMWQTVTPKEIFNEMEFFFHSHPVAQDKNIIFKNEHDDIDLRTDLSLVLRIICNMITNACEATEKSGDVKIWIERDNNELTFCIWNKQAIPEDVQRRVFQRNFSTKSETGRGVGTFSMKLFAEKILGGKVTFSSTEQDGTCFRLILPIQ